MTTHYNKIKDGKAGIAPLCGQVSPKGGISKGYYTKNPEWVDCKKCITKLAHEGLLPYPKERNHK